MKTTLEYKCYDTMLEASDWRYSAAIVGLMQYLDYHDLDYEDKDDVIYYSSGDITEDKYLKFVEYKYGEELHHKVIENILAKSEITDEEVKLINEKLVANTIMKNTFKKIKFNKDNQEEILKIINENKEAIIRETFREKKNMYVNYANKNKLFNETQNICRLVGYYIDASRKGKSIGYNFDTNNYLGFDYKEFDFIPFGFEGNIESFFINDNYSIKQMINSNNILRRKVRSEVTEKKIKDIREILFNTIIETSDFIKRDVEVIFKVRGQDYFETLFIRKESIDIFKKLESEKIDYKVFATSYKVTDKYYINVQKGVTESILNNVLLDNLIDTLLKNGNKSYLISQLIKVNVLIRRDNEMKNKLKGAYACAKKVAESLEKNKLESYRQKLTSSIIFKDYNRVCQILLQLSNYSGIEFNFVYDLYDDFEENKDLAYTFVNALTKKSPSENNNLI